MPSQCTSFLELWREELAFQCPRRALREGQVEVVEL